MSNFDQLKFFYAIFFNTNIIFLFGFNKIIFRLIIVFIYSKIVL